MPIALVQSNNGGYNSASGVSGNQSLNSTSGTPHFASTTGAGDLLLCICVADMDVTGASAIVPTIGTPVTAGLIWIPLTNETVTFSTGGTNFGYAIAVYYAAGAPSIASSTTVEFTATFTGCPANSALGMENYLLEFSGVQSVSPVDAYAIATGTITDAPATASLHTTATDLIVSCYTPIDAPSNGPGYTAITFSGMALQYILNQASGTIPTAWGAADDAGSWAAIAVAFKPAGLPLPILNVSPLSLTFSALQGGANPASQNVAISNGDGGTLNWTVTSDSTWLSELPTSGTGNGTIVVKADITGLAPGNYTGHLTVAAAGATGSPQNVTVNLSILTSTGGGGSTPCIPTYSFGAFISDLGLYIGPATALYNSQVPTANITVNESVAQGRNAIIVDFNGSEGLYSRDLETVFTWPIASAQILDIYQPSIIPMDDDVYDRLSFHFLMTSLGVEGWAHLREINLAYASTVDANLLLTFDQWPDINITVPSSGGKEIKQKFVVPANKFKLVEGYLSCTQPLKLWGSDVIFKIGAWGRVDSYRVVRPLVS